MTVTEPILALDRLPSDPDELWWTVYGLFGVKIPRVQICSEHCSPFDAFCAAYFATSPVIVWWASRGFGGKSFLLSTLSNTEAALLGSEVTVLGGSFNQALNVHQHGQNLWTSEKAPKDLIEGESTKSAVNFKNGGAITALPASQKSARGPHPQRLRLDEIDEMDLAILRAAQGQPMEKNGIAAQTVMSSTYQNPDGTMTQILKDAREMSWPIYQWCWRESMGTRQNRGWLKPSMVRQKQAEVMPAFWNVEYDLQVPSIEGRAIDFDSVEAMFVEPERQDQSGQEMVFEEPVLPDVDLKLSPSYITGIDWAKEKDWTIIWTYRVDVRPWRCVAYQRVNKLKWQDMVARANSRIATYPGVLVHDATGIGNVVDDLLDAPYGSKVVPIVLRGRDREIVFNEYISAIEAGELTCPRIGFAYQEHLYVRREDLFKTGGHPPDSFIAGALAWLGRNHAANTVPSPLDNDGLTKQSGWEMQSVTGDSEQGWMSGWSG